MKNDSIYLIHILESIEFINRHTQKDMKVFLDNELVYESCLKKLQNLAESANRLSDRIKDLHPEINWKNVRGFRNVIAHDYLGEIEPNIIWDVIIIELPKLIEIAKRELENDHN